MANNICFGGGNGGGGSSTLSGLSDVTLTTPTSGQVLKYDGSKWVNGEGGGSSGHNYSTTEQVVGTWIDGSTIYEKTIQKTINCNTELVIVDATDIPNLNAIISYEGNFGIVPLNFFNNSDYRSYTHTINGVLNGFVKLGNTATVDATITIRYTKSA